MKKIISIILIITACTGTLLAQTFEDIVAQHQKFQSAINECLKNKDYPAAEKHCNEAIAWFDGLPDEMQESVKQLQAGNYYNLACAYSLQKQTQKAVDAFEKSVNEYGYIRYAHAKSDTDLDNIRANKRFIALMENIRKKGDFVYMLKRAGKYRKADNTTYLPRFTYQSATDYRLKDVRKYFNLDSIAGEGDDISKIINLMTWIHNNIRHDGNNYALSEFDAIDLYHYHKATGKGINCRHLAIALNEMYLSMGFKSRYVTCLPKSEDDQDCHVINAVWSETLQKWLWMDPTNNAYVKDENGNLLSIAEVRERLIDDRPLVLNDDANWNNETKKTKENYLDSYMAKNLYWIQCIADSRFNPESRYRGNDGKYISLYPTDYERESTNNDGVIIHDPDYFWQKP